MIVVHLLHASKQALYLTRERPDLGLSASFKFFERFVFFAELSAGCSTVLFTEIFHGWSISCTEKNDRWIKTHRLSFFLVRNIDRCITLIMLAKV